MLACLPQMLLLPFQLQLRIVHEQSLTHAAATAVAAAASVAVCACCNA
jgi:hypothetical protein